MTNRELFESQYLLNDAEYLDKFCSDEAEAYCIEKDLKYDRDCWLFNRKNYELEDSYDEESEP